MKTRIILIRATTAKELDKRIEDTLRRRGMEFKSKGVSKEQGYAIYWAKFTHTLEDRE